MASQDNAETELEGRYAPPAMSIDSRVSELAQVLDIFLGADARADGSATWKGPPNRTKRYRALSEWSAAVTQTPSYASLYLSAVDSTRRAAFFLDAQGIQVKVAAADTEIEAARESLRGIEAALQLEAEEEASESGRASSERQYLFEKPALPATLLRVLEAAAAIATPNPRTWINVRTRDNAAIQLQSLDDARLDAVFDTRWSDVVGVDCELSTRRVSLRFNYQFPESLLHLRVEARNGDKVHEYIESVERAGMLEAMPTESAFKGRSKLFSPKSALDAQWFARAAKALAAAVPSIGYTSCRYRLVDAPTEEVVNRDFQQWSQDVLGDWDRVATAQCSLDARIARASMRIDPRREQVELSIEATTDARADAIMASLVRDLELEVVREAAPNRRTAASFQVTQWGNKPFAKALEAALTRVFGDRPPAIEEAYVEEIVGDGVDRHTIKDLDTLLTRLKASEPFGGVGLRAVARDDAIGVYLTPPKNRDGFRTLEIKSSYDAKVFPDLVEVFKRLGLEPLPASGDGGETSAVASRSSKGFDWRSALLPALVGAVLTSTFWVSILPTTSLEIIVPAHIGDSVVSMPAGLDSVLVEWVIKRTQFFQTKVLQNEPASVRVLRTSGQAMYATTALGQVAVPVVAGPQVIEVKTPDGNKRAVLSIVVPALAVPASVQSARPVRNR